MTSKKQRTLLEKLKIRHRWNKRTGLYKFLFSIILKLVLVVALIAAILLILNHFIELEILIGKLSSLGIWEVLSVFYISESFLGWIPPDIFIAWSEQFNKPFLWLTILGTVSYLGGINAYYIGQLALKYPKIKNWLEKKNEEFFVRIRKWGGIVIIFAALFPLPYATTATVAGMIKYPTKLFYLYGLTRYLRFYLYGTGIFAAMDKFL